MNFFDIFFLCVILFTCPNPSISERRVLYDLEKFSRNVTSRTDVVVYSNASLWMERVARETIYSIEAADSRTTFGVWDIEVTYLSAAMIKFMKIPEPQGLLLNCTLKFPILNGALNFFNEYIRENFLNLLDRNAAEELIKVDSNNRRTTLAREVLIFRSMNRNREFTYSLRISRPQGVRTTYAIFSSGDFKARCVNAKNIEITTHATIDGSSESNKFELVFGTAHQRLQFFRTLYNDDARIQQFESDFDDADCARGDVLDTTNIVGARANGDIARAHANGANNSLANGHTRRNEAQRRFGNRR